MSTPAAALHSDIEQPLNTLCRDLADRLSDDLVGVALYGGLVKGRYTPGISDVNVLVVVRRADFDTLQRAADPLTAARRTSRIVALVLTPEELSELAQVFPVKIADIKAAHRVLHGTIPFDKLLIDPKLLVLRVRQQLSNMELRARSIMIAHGSDPDLIWQHITQTLPKLTVTLETVLRVPGVRLPPDRPGILRRASEVLHVPELAKFAELHRHEGRPPDDDVKAYARSWLTLFDELEFAVERALQ
jgi:predicted nucleotidyltransferase